MDITAAAVERHVRKLAGEIGERNVFRPEALAAAADYVEGEFSSQGHEVAVQEYEARDVPSRNFEVTIAGAAQTTEIILIGAHYDSVLGSPGADDNASAVAALIEIARCLKGERLPRTVRLAAFVNEEPPFFFWGNMGSQIYAKAARRRGDDIRLMLSLEMLGCFSDAPGSQRYPPLFRYFYPDRGNFIAFVSNLRSRGAMRRAVAAFRAGSDFPCEHTATFSWIPGVAWSDHLSFWRQGYRAAMVTDTAFYRYPYYHSALDTPDRLDYPRLARVSEALAGMVRGLASDPGL
ncbi:MAG: M28 family peptidase [Betaproteobacteria bacterium]|nr:M28 family peptidase [Betaproteobacteria bacterium]